MATTHTEPDVGRRLALLFQDSPDSIQRKLRNFPKYVRAESLRRFLTLYELFKLAVPVKGSIVECGVYRGFSLMAWAKLAAILEPGGASRRIYGFDTFGGFPAVHDHDQSAVKTSVVGELAADSYEELLALIREGQANPGPGATPPIELVRGDMVDTIPEFLERHRHLLVSLLFLDCDLYEPTRAALQHFVPRMPRGAVLAFDELDRPAWPGETQALLEALGVRGLRLRRLPWEPDISYAVLD